MDRPTGRLPDFFRFPDWAWTLWSIFIVIKPLRNHCFAWLTCFGQNTKRLLNWLLIETVLKWFHIWTFDCVFSCSFQNRLPHQFATVCVCLGSEYEPWLFILLVTSHIWTWVGILLATSQQALLSRFICQGFLLLQYLESVRAEGFIQSKSLAISLWCDVRFHCLNNETSYWSETMSTFRFVTVRHACCMYMNTVTARLLYKTSVIDLSIWPHRGHFKKRITKIILLHFSKGI